MTGFSNKRCVTFCRMILLLCPHTPYSGNHLLKDTSWAAAPTSSFHHTNLKTSHPPGRLACATTLTWVLPRSVCWHVCVILKWHHSVYDGHSRFSICFHSVCLRSTTWSRQAGHPTDEGTWCLWMRRGRMVPRRKGLVWMISRPGRGDWETWWTTVPWQEGRTSLLQLQRLNCTRADKSIKSLSAPVSETVATVSGVRRRAQSSFVFLSVQSCLGSSSLSFFLAVCSLCLFLLFFGGAPHCFWHQQCCLGVLD